MTLHNYLSYVESQLKPTESLFRLVPMENIDWKPMEKLFTAGQLMSHIGGGLRVYGNGIANGNWGFTSMREIFVRNRTQDSLSVEEAVRKLYTCHTEFATLLGALSEEEFQNGEVDTPQLGRVPRWRIAMLCVEHHLNNKAELFMYLKLLGVDVNTGTLYRG